MSITGRARIAAAAYLTRCGYYIVDENWIGPSRQTIHIVAIDGDNEFVFVKVSARTDVKVTPPPSTALTTTQKRKLTKRAGEYLEMNKLDEENIGPSMTWRWDYIDLLVLAKNRALLRHHRSVYQKSGV